MQMQIVAIYFYIWCFLYCNKPFYQVLYFCYDYTCHWLSSHHKFLIGSRSRGELFVIWGILQKKVYWAKLRCSVITKLKADKLGLRKISDNAEEFWLKLWFFCYLLINFWPKMAEWWWILIKMLDIALRCAQIIYI